MAVRQSEVLFAPYQATFNAIDLGGIQSVDIQIENKTASAELINGVTLNRDVNKKVSVVMELVETAGLKTALAALFPSIYTTNTGKGQVLWNVTTCGSVASSAPLIISSECDTATAEDIIFYGARPNLDGISVSTDGARIVTVRFEIEGDNTGKLFQLGSVA